MFRLRGILEKISNSNEAIETCYYDGIFVTKYPEQAGIIIRHVLGGGKANGINLGGDEYALGFLERLSVYTNLLKRENMELSLENMKSYILNFLVSAEMGKYSYLQMVYKELVSVLKDPTDHGFHLGFKRKMLKNSYTGKEERYAQNTVNSIMEKLLGKGEGNCSITTSQLLRTKDVDSAVSPLVKEFLTCDLFEGCINFVERNPDIMNWEHRVEFLEQVVRLLFVNRKRDAQQCNIRMVFVMFAKSLKDLTRSYFTSKKLEKFFKTASENFTVTEKQSLYHLENHVNKFVYQFTIPKKYDEFVVTIPSEGSDKRSLFETLPSELRDAITRESPEAISVSLKAMSPAVYAKSLRNCAQGGFFYFKFKVPYSDFRPYENEVRQALSH